MISKRVATLASAAAAASLMAAWNAAAAPARRTAARPAARTSTPAAATASGADVRCLLISRLLMQSGDTSHQAMGAAGSLYFSARLQGRMTDRQIEAALVADAQKAPPSPDQTKGCGDRLDARLAELDALSQRVDARLDAVSPRPAPRPAADAAPPASAPIETPAEPPPPSLLTTPQPSSPAPSPPPASPQG